MIHQYHAQRSRRLPDGRAVGTVPVGTILYIQEPRHQRAYGRVRRNPWIVEAWLPREYHPCVAGRPGTVYMAGGHLAQVRSLRDGSRRTCADWLLLASTEEEG